MQTIKFKINEVPVTLIKTDKFKTVHMQIHFFGEFNEEMATRRSLLCRVLQDTCKKYNTDEKVANKSLDLYNTDCYIASLSLYKSYDTCFSTSFISEKYLPKKESLTKEVIDYLCEFLFNPNAEDESFDEKEFEEKKRNLAIKINNLYNNKSGWAIRRFLQTMGKDEIFSVSSLGTIENLNKITKESLYEEYKRLLNEDCYIYVCGDITKEELTKVLSAFKVLKNKHNKLFLYDEKKHPVEKVKEVIEERPTNQAQLVMGYRAPCNIMDEDFQACKIFCLMFGGLFSSSLFKEIREKHSLAYSIYSSYLSDHKLMVVHAGIDEENYELTVKLIKEEFEKYRQGLIDEELLEIAKDQILASVEEIEDKASSMIEYAMRFDIYDNPNTIEKIVRDVHKVTKEDIIRVSREFILDTIYLQKNGDQNEN